MDDLDIERELEGTPFKHVRSLARGGMGEVHVVRHIELREDRVMKIVRVVDPELTELIAKRTLSEGRLLRGLRHPNIVELHDLGRTKSGKPYLITELLIGRTLKEEIDARGRLPWREVVEILMQVLSGLELAHQRGVVHRDIKPLNLFVESGENRNVKILDFGIAKVLSEEAASRAGSALVATQEGFFLGSPAFMPPEQAMGAVLDGRTDLYAVGAVGFYMLTGSLLYPGRRRDEAILAHVREPAPAARSIEPSVPAALDDLLAKALSKAPTARHKSAGAMRDALSALLTPVASRVTAPAPTDATEPLSRPTMERRNVPTTRAQQTVRMPATPTGPGTHDDVDTIPEASPDLLLAEPPPTSFVRPQLPARPRETGSRWHRSMLLGLVLILSVTAIVLASLLVLRAFGAEV